MVSFVTIRCKELTDRSYIEPVYVTIRYIQAAVEHWMPHSQHSVNYIILAAIWSAVLIAVAVSVPSRNVYKAYNVEHVSSYFTH
jgi:hypothetical protein